MRKRVDVSRRVVIIGSINRDTVRSPDGAVRRDWGGILYNVRAADRHYPKDWTIAPVAWLGRGARRPVREMVARMRRVDGAGLLDHPGVHNHCRLDYDADGERRERLDPILPPMPYERIAPHLEGDAVLLNPITGADFTVRTARRIRERCDGVIYLDVHSLMLGRRRDGTRFRRRHRESDGYLRVADYVQMNAWEFEVLFDRTFATPDCSSPLNTLSERARAVFVTRGELGCSVMTRRGTGWTCRSVRAPRVVTSGDPTGCGDVFGAVCLGELLRGRGPLTAARAGVAAATEALVATGRFHSERRLR